MNYGHAFLSWRTLLSAICRVSNSNWTCLPTAAVHVAAPAAIHHDVPPSATGLPPSSHSTHTPPQSSHLSLSAGSSTSVNPNHQQELQAKILSLFNSGTGSVGAGVTSSVVSQSQAYGSFGPSSSQNTPRPAMNVPPTVAPQGYGTPPGRVQLAQGGQRPPTSASGINFDNPSVQKALDTLIQSGPSLNHLVGAAASTQAPPQRPAPALGQVPPMSMYPRHYWRVVVNSTSPSDPTPQNIENLPVV